MKMNLRMLALVAGGGLIVVINSACAQTWTLTSAPATNWTSVASSADGSRLVATGSGLVYVSTNAGETWMATFAPVTNWTVVASSADGSHLLAAGGGYAGSGPVFISTNSGDTWRDAGAPYYGWLAAASSANGNTLAVACGGIFGGRILYSTNGGTTWTDADPLATGNQVWRSSALSADGQKLVVVGSLAAPRGASGIATSTNRGATWVATNDMEFWQCVACSANGTRLIAGSVYAIYTSQDFGITWTQASTPMGGFWVSVASSADGNRLVALRSASGSETNIYTSTDAGVNWQPAVASAANWKSVASSADGHKLVAAVYRGGIYTCQTTPKPVLDLTPSATGFLISWIVPSMPFVLQENADLTTTNWNDVTTAPILNFTNLYYEVSVPVASANRFYRLKSL
jgi:photosystem II stability/assembly factor-like uncharacterized protein